VSSVRDRLGLPVVHVEPGALVLHAASFGEGRIAAALAAAVTRMRPEVAIVRTFTRAAASRVDTGAWQDLAWPLDLPGVTGAWLDRVRPRAVWLCEAELWPCMLAACRSRRIPVAVVGATARDGTLRLLRAWPGVGRGLRWLPADTRAEARLRAVLGSDGDIEGTPTGDLKLAAPVEAAPWPDRPQRPVVIAGSTHPADEAALLPAWRALLRSTPDAARPLLVIAPRDAARARSVCVAAAGVGLRALTWGGRAGGPDADVLVLDTLGVLAGLYPHARAAFIGGTVGRAGRPHAPSEALACGLPVIGGPGAAGTAWAHPRARAVPVDRLPDALRDALAAGREQPAPAAGANADAVVRRLRWTLDTPVPTERAPRPWLLPLGWVWEGLATARTRLERPRAPVPVIAVGALIAGGAGKTEVAAWIAAQLPGAWIAARGTARGGGWLGDEPAMLAARGFDVVRGPDRHAAARAAVDAGARCVVLDDGWTTPTVAHDLAVVCIDARRPTGGAAIPAGEGKVPASSLRHAHAVVSLHGPLPGDLRGWLRPDAVVAEARYVPTGWIHDGQALPLDAFPPGDVDVLVGIAHPGGLLRLLRGLGVRPRAVRRRPDHHVFGRADLAWIGGSGRTHATRPVVTTEKDLARLPTATGAWALRIGLAFDSGEDALRACVEAACVPPAAR
jgi:tetraacyldisaccharide-1-P 4'-kinase/3-deoxy-D-manno-octulosonic-acid transferase